ncbi:MAG TPA: hypothetical protein PK402_07635, partial [Tepidisphaeraceae bacterium]|nr:hypothetical protein [Tepidisphaeraceae bacterium]
GCRLYCCWCAQDLEANHFWEAMGFVPVAFRSGAKKKLKGKDGKRTDRVHIFWQKRIRAGDTETPWWYPSQTGGGAIKEDRIVLPIPPGVHWSEVKSVVLPGDEATNDERLAIGDQSSPNATRLSLPKSAPTPNDEVETPGVEQKSKRTSKSKSNLTAQNSQPATGKKEPFTLRCSAIYFTPPVVEKPKAEKAKKEKAPKVKQKNDPKLVKAARELRDRYLEEVNQNPTLVSNGKYDVARLVEKTTVETVAPSVKLLDVLPVEVKRVEPMAA